MMEDKKEILRLLYRFEEAGLVTKCSEEVLSCFAGKILGIGVGEQGFVTNIQEVRQVFESGLKTEDDTEHTLDYGRTEIMLMDEKYAVVCAEVKVNARVPGREKVITSQFQQSLTVVKEDEGWKICGLHASTPIVTEEYIEAYPLKFAEKTLRSLKEKIGEAAYTAEEQFRKAVLSDAIAFYIINFTTNSFEKCQRQNELCVLVDEGTPYEEFLREKSPEYVFEEDLSLFIEHLSLYAIETAFQDSGNEVSCEYRMKCPDGELLWTKTIVRLITDVVSGHRKGIMYVKNIDEEKRKTIRIQEKVDYDGMTKVLNKEAMIREIDRQMQGNGLHGGVLLMLDVDNFKSVNDTYGHPVGDQVLTSLAGLLKASFVENSLIGRIGGDEFAVFLSGRRPETEVKEMMEYFLETVRNFRLEENPQLRMFVSMGAACLTKGSFEELYREADSALYQAKENGKNCAVFKG